MVGQPYPLHPFSVLTFEADISLVQDLSRVIEQSTGRHAGKLDRWHYTKSATIKITGRHVLPIWRLLKSDVNLLQYSFENVVYHILHIRCVLNGM